MIVLIVLAALLMLIVLISWGKVNAFLAFLIVSLFTGLMLGIPVNKIAGSVYKGIGDTLGSLVIVVVLGAMLGKLVAESGAASRIAASMMKTFGEKYIRVALMITGFIVGIPLFYNVGFVLMIPLIFSVVYQYKLPAVYIGLPMLASLSVTHGFLPPHPSPAALVLQFKASMGLTLVYGMLVAIPAIVIAGGLFGKTVKHIVSVPLEGFIPKMNLQGKIPGTLNSFLSSLLPVFLLMITTALPYVFSFDAAFTPVLAFIAEPAIIMLIALGVATFTLGISSGKSMEEVMKIYSEAVKDVAMILLIVAGAGVLKQVFVDSGVSNSIGAALTGWEMNPLILGWMIAAVIRVCLGSATVAGLTAAGILAPIVAGSSVNLSLMVLSIGAGSLMFSHVNDAGFWLFKEYFNLSIKDTLRSWSVMESIVAVVGLAGVLLLDLFV